MTAVADPTRRSILTRLACGPATVGELAAPFRISQQAVSKHLALLERAGLMTKERRGRQHVCTLDPRPLRDVAQWAETFKQFWEESFERLDELLGQMDKKESES